MKTTANKNAVLYVRVSTDEQAKHGYSIDMQQNQCFNFAQKEGYIITGVYIDDGYTARNEKRPQYQKLLIDIKNKSNNINAVIVWRCDRMVRNNSLYHSQIVPKFAKYGVLLLSATENNDINNPYGRYIRNSQINNAELESELTSIRTKENLKEKARQGYYPASIPPVGYIRAKIDGKKIIIPDKEKAPYIKEVFQLYTRGGFSFRDIADKLSRKGFQHNNKPCTKKLIENILTVYDIFYVGKFRYKGEIYNGKHEPILTTEEYENFKRARALKYAPKTKKHDFLYRGLIKCTLTNKIFIGEEQTGANNSGIYQYYRCHHCNLKKDCKRIIKSNIIDKLVIDAINTLTITKKEFAIFKDDLKTIMYKNYSMNEERLKQIQPQIKKLESRMLALYDDKIDGVITEEFYKQKRDLWQNQLDDYQLEITALTNTQKEIFKRIENALELCKDLSGAYLRHTDEEKRILLNLLCSNFFYDGSKLTITIKEPFKALINFAIFKNGASDGIRTHAYRNHNPRS